MFFAKIPRHASQNAITEGDFKCILARNCEGTEQLRTKLIFWKVNKGCRLLTTPLLCIRESGPPFRFFCHPILSLNF